MWLYVKKEVGGAINTELFDSFDEAFETCSKTIERDFACTYMYRKEIIKQLILKYKYLSYNFGWYDPVCIGVVDMNDNGEHRFYPHEFNPLKDYNNEENISKK